MMEKIKERVLLLKRFIIDDSELYRIAEGCNVDVDDRLREKYERASKYGGYFYLSLDEKEELVLKIAEKITDDKLVDVFNRLRPKDFLGFGFRGKFYYYSEEDGFELRNCWVDVKRDVLEALDQIGERGYVFLKALITLYEQGKWKGYYYGAKYSDIIRVMRNIYGRPIFPAPRDFVILKSYNIYYKSGSRKYPGHSIPEEIIPAVKEALNEWIRYRRRGASG